MDDYGIFEHDPGGPWTVPAPTRHDETSRLLVYPPTPFLSDTLPALPRTSERRRARNWTSNLAIVAVGLILTIIIRTTLVQSYDIPSPSMTPTLQTGDRVAVWKPISAAKLDRGDIIVFTHPTDTECPIEPDAPKVFIKRVIGLPSETVDAHDGKVTVDGVLIDEPYVEKGLVTVMPVPMAVPDGELLVLGDHREISLDGRCFGTIKDDAVVGRAVVRFWPPSRAGGL